MHTVSAPSERRVRSRASASHLGVVHGLADLVLQVLSLGIAVEFNAHIARAFMGASGLPVDLLSRQKERDERIWTALVDVGPSVSDEDTITITS